MWHVWDGISRANKDGGAKENKNTAARFICALCLAFPDGNSRTYEGTVEGNIVWPPRGENGFGYDPIFQMVGDSLTCGEITPAEKHAKSHRADAFKKFLKAEFDQ